MARAAGARVFLYPDEISYWEPADSLAILKLLAASAGADAARGACAPASRWPIRSAGRNWSPCRASWRCPAMQACSRRATGCARTPHGGGAGLGLDAGGLSGAVGRGFGQWLCGGIGADGGLGRAAGQRPALALTAPGLWYLARLELSLRRRHRRHHPRHSGGAVGRNTRLAWGITPAQIDDQDIYIEEVQPGDANRYRGANGWTEFTTWRETLQVRGAPPRPSPCARNR